MKCPTAPSAAFFAGLIAAAVAVADASAGTLVTHPGSMCKYTLPGDAAVLGYEGPGVYSIKAAETVVTCPLTRRTTNANGAYAYVWLEHTVTATTSCALFSSNVFGTILGSNNKSFTGLGQGYIILTLAGAGKSNEFSRYTVLCNMPGASRGKIWGVDLNEQ